MIKALITARFCLGFQQVRNSIRPMATPSYRSLTKNDAPIALAMTPGRKDHEPLWPGSAQRKRLRQRFKFASGHGAGS